MDNNYSCLYGRGLYDIRRPVFTVRRAYASSQNDAGETFYFLQLPPVDKDGSRRSLALPLDEVGKVVVDEDDNAEATRKAHHAEARQGSELWRSIRRVVCLTVNIRAPDALGRLQDEMRSGKISDEM